MRIIVLILWALTLYAQERIENYQIDVSIHQSGMLSIQEEIVYDFGTSERHGIYRDIPHTVKISPYSLPSDIGLEHFEVMMDGHRIPLMTSKINGDSGSNIRLRIGDPNQYLTGQHRYRIRYEVRQGILGTPNNLDAVRWNAVGTGWNVPIHKVNVIVHLPSSLSQNNVNLRTFTGTYGSVSSQATHRWKDTQTLEIDVQDLASHEGVTFELGFALHTLEQSSEITASEALNLWVKKFWHWVFLGGFWFYLYRYVQSNQSAQPITSVVVHYDLPKDLDILQSGLIYDYFADDKDFSPAMVELAQQGYLNINNKAKELRVERTDKDTASLSFAQRYLLDNILFDNKKSFIFSTSSTTKARKLQEGFSAINEQLYTWSEQEKYLKENPQTSRQTFVWRVIPIVLLFAVFGIALGIKMLGFEAMAMIGFISIFWIVGLSLAIFVEGWFTKLFGAMFVFIPSIILVAGLSSDQLALLPYTFIITVPFILGLICYYYKRIGAYTPKGARTYAHLEGYKEFIKRVKVDEIKRRLESDPEFLDKALPYAMLFGYSDKWTEFYTLLNLSNPLWYSGNIHEIGDISSSVQQASTIQSTASSSGGYSGGGGFSGGGGGGGGGGSW